MSRADDVAEIFPDHDIVQMDGFDECIIGYAEPLNETPKLCYSVDKIIDKLCEDMSYEDAQEHFDFNIGGSHGPVILVYTP